MKQSLNFLKLFFLTLCIFYSTTILAQTYPEGMISYWKFDEGVGSTAMDVVGDNDGIIHGATTTSGMIGQAFNFNGQDAYVEIPNDPNLNMTEELTLETWIYPRNIVEGSHLIVQRPYALFLDPFEGYQEFDDIVAFDFDDETGYYNVVGWGHPIQAEQWQHIVLTYNLGAMKLYCNGELIREKLEDVAETLPTRDGPITIGCTVGGGMYFNGKMDEVAIYNRALTSEEISKHHQNGLNGLGYEESISVSIDIKPGSVPNSINPNSKGVIPVAIISTEDFDAATINIGSVNFSSGNAIPAHGGHFKDVDEDGDIDLLLHFPTQDIELTADDLELCLTGQLLNGVHFNGCDQITIRGKLKKDLTHSITQATIKYHMIQNYPNPFNPNTTIEYFIPKESVVSLKIYNVIGTEVAILVEELQSPGNYKVKWDASNQPSGVYFYTITAGIFTETKKMIVMK